MLFVDEPSWRSLDIREAEWTKKKCQARLMKVQRQIGFPFIESVVGSSFGLSRRYFLYKARPAGHWGKNVKSGFTISRSIENWCRWWCDWRKKDEINCPRSIVHEGSPLREWASPTR